MNNKRICSRLTALTVAMVGARDPTDAKAVRPEQIRLLNNKSVC